MKDLALAGFEALVGFSVPVLFLVVARFLNTPHKARLEAAEHDRARAETLAKATYGATKNTLNSGANKSDWEQHFPSNIQSLTVTRIDELEDAYRSRPTSTWLTWNHSQDPKAAHTALLGAYKTLRASARIKANHRLLLEGHVQSAGSSSLTRWRRRWTIGMLATLACWYFMPVLFKSLAASELGWAPLPNPESWTDAQGALVGLLVSVTAAVGVGVAWSIFLNNDHYWRRSEGWARVAQVVIRVLAVSCAPAIAIGTALSAAQIGTLAMRLTF